MQISVGAKRRDGVWRAATAVDGNLLDVQIDGDLAVVLNDSIGMLLRQEFAEGTRLTVTVKVEKDAE